MTLNNKILAIATTALVTSSAGSVISYSVTTNIKVAEKIKEPINTETVPKSKGDGCYDFSNWPCVSMGKETYDDWF
ncbi:hypothetical protein A6V39_04990 [Candidatus Mycoplasma haematobovis]|uniref:Uncharacterized protein n=1 Tax=Candidatus Mycoplasma haematobovis TaxID=432608 RepID=A0A1A9QBF1_9MOLU|nr:hypothetical protein [Candidatus Mycoplasma haematobovis]OAL09783.1 hypothetical protein A6V39_04990 [Candidatus Mycoplasma haematobovis]